MIGVCAEDKLDDVLSVLRREGETAYRLGHIIPREGDMEGTVYRGMINL